MRSNAHKELVKFIFFVLKLNIFCESLQIFYKAFVSRMFSRNYIGFFLRKFFQNYIFFSTNNWTIIFVHNLNSTGKCLTRVTKICENAKMKKYVSTLDLMQPRLCLLCLECPPEQEARPQQIRGPWEDSWILSSPWWFLHNKGLNITTRRCRLS